MPSTSDLARASIAERLSRWAATIPDNAALINGAGTTTFAALEERAQSAAAALESLGVRRGTRAALMVPPSPDFFIMTFALFRSGAVPVLIDPGIGWSNLGRCLEQAAPEAFIGVPKAHLGRLLGGWARRSLRHLVTVGGPRLWGGHSLSCLTAQRRQSAPITGRGGDDADPAAILFTSGSTGVPKGAVYTRENFRAQLDALEGHFGIKPGDVSVATFPLFALFDVALGQTVVIPEMDATRPARVDPREIIEPVKRHGAVQLFGSPALLDRVGRYAEERGEKLPSLRRVISAGAPVSPKVIRRFSRLLDERAVIHTPYGATEALPVSCIESPEILAETAALSEQGRGICVGRPLPGMEIRIIPISEAAEASLPESLPGGEIGELAVRGPVVTSSYDKREDLTALAKIPSPRGVFHRMGDLAALDPQGRIWFCGRKSQRVAAAGGTLFTIPCEGVFNRHPLVRRSALVGARGRPVLCVEAEPEASDREALRRELLDLASSYPHTSAIRTVLFHDAFPVDIRHNAKIFREKLAVWAEGELR